MQNLTRLAGALPKNPNFRAWLHEAAQMPVSVDDAAEFIRIACGVDSRRELNTNARAADVFLSNVVQPYSRWANQQHQP